MKVRKEAFYLGIIIITLSWLIIILLAIENIDTTMWGVDVLFGAMAVLGIVLYIYLKSVKPVDMFDDELLTAMVTHIDSKIVQPGDCLSCYEPLGRFDTVLTNCDHRFHKDCYYQNNLKYNYSNNADVFFCPSCDNMVEKQTIYNYTGVKHDEEDLVNLKRQHMVEISLN